MIELATADDPDVFCAQEVPAWALGDFTVGDVAARASFGPLPIPASLGRALTDIDNGLLRSLFSGQGNAILLSPRLRVVDHGVLTLNSARFRRREARAFGLDLVDRLAWGKERRIVQAVRVEGEGRPPFVVANLHCTGFRRDIRVTESELLRGASFTVSFARPGETVVLAGDFNLTVLVSRALRDLTGPEWGFSEAGPGIDHILVQGGASVSPIRSWDDERRAFGDVLLSDHAPVELDLQLG
jgi:endonuclease/exonuclease/phosphatase family metal-dependent hydrolase